MLNTRIQTIQTKQVGRVDPNMTKSEGNYALLNSNHHLILNQYYKSYADVPNTQPPKYTNSSQISFFFFLYFWQDKSNF